MQWNIGKQKKEYEKRLQYEEKVRNWHDYFIWRPTNLSCLDRTVWLETVERRWVPPTFERLSIYEDGYWQYRLKDKK